MSLQLLTSAEAARRLGIQVSTLYDWLNQSDGDCLVIRGQQTTIDYFQAGRRGQGRIRIDAMEVERLLSLMRVSPKPSTHRDAPTPKPNLHHIRTKLGRPDE